MAVKTKVEAIDRDIAVILSDTLSPAAQSKALAAFAGETIEAATRANRQILGRDAPRTIYVDGKKGAPLASVRPDGSIVAEFDVVSDALAWIGEQLELHSPKASPDPNPSVVYKRSHELFADGTAVPIGEPVPSAEEYIFINTLPYARKIETGSSSQAPDGVFQAVATLGRRRFSKVARIAFSYRAAVSGAIVKGRAGNKSSGRYPAIVVKLR